jgi:urea carboxylase-associated protein 2
MAALTRQQIAEANRQRYEELRAAGQGATLKALPHVTARDGARIAPETVISREQVPPGWYTIMRLRRGEALRIMDDAGAASVALVGWRAEDTSERINCADTVKVQWSASLTKGRVILSDMGRVLLSVIEDSSGAHDLLVGGSTPADAPGRNTRDNFVAAAAKLGLSLCDIPPCATFFAPVSVDRAGRFRWDAARKHKGDFVDLRAEMNLLLALSNCPHPLDPAAAVAAAAGTITLIRHRPAAPTADDPCRTASPEAERAFTFTDRLFA